MQYTKQFILRFVSLIFLAGTVATFTSCNGDEEPPTNSKTDNSGTSNWDLVITVDLGGAFEVTADMVLTLKETTFDATITTKDIAGSPETHVTEFTGTRDGDKLTVSNQVFNITPTGGTEEEVTLKQGEFTITGNTLSGTGNMAVDFKDGNPPFDGSCTFTGTKK
ncbi:MAG: hypothetical protein JJ975_15990 [Bacteroidia bacterium]|nr:hypothetical protein [Bacteroidia bacterium]